MPSELVTAASATIIAAIEAEFDVSIAASSTPAFPS